MKILVLGGAGYIGSHTCVALAAAGEPYLVLDNFSNSRHSVLERVARITGATPQYIEGDVRDPALLENVKPGDKVKFTAEQIGSALVVTDLQPAPASQ